MANVKPHRRIPKTEIKILANLGQLNRALDNPAKLGGKSRPDAATGLGSHQYNSFSCCVVM